MSDHQKIDEALEILRKAAKEKRVELVDFVKGIYAQAKDFEERAVDKAKKVAGDVDKSVHNNPWPYIGGAALAGIVIGFLLRRKK